MEAWGWRRRGWYPRHVFSLTAPVDLGSSALNLLAASLAASFAMLGPRVFSRTALSDPYVLGVLAGAILGFWLHELMHEYTARRRGCWARFMLHPLGFIVTIASGLLPIAVITPGAVMVACRGPWSPRLEEELSTSGVKANMALAFAAVLAERLAPNPWTAVFAAGFGGINAWVAFFNLLPIPPLDGSKLARVNPAKWIIYFAVAVLLLMLV